MGDKWNPNGAGCFSITSAINDTLNLYAGTNNTVLKTTDGGNSWFKTGLDVDDAMFSSIVVNSENPDEVFAGGRTINNHFILYKTSNAGIDWEMVVPVVNCNCIIAGINCMQGVVVNGKFRLYIGTDGNGIFKYVDDIVSTEEKNEVIPGTLILYQNYPNPFNPLTTIKYFLYKEEKITIKIYDSIGNLISVLLNEIKQPGEYEIDFNPSNLPAGRQGLTSGIYYCEVTAGASRQFNKMVLIK